MLGEFASEIAHDRDCDEVCHELGWPIRVVEELQRTRYVDKLRSLRIQIPKLIQNVAPAIVRRPRGCGDSALATRYPTNVGQRQQIRQLRRFIRKV